MTVQQFIEKAGAGGWNGSSSYMAFDHMSIFLDPLAWQAVGKVEGWCFGHPCQPNGECSECSFRGHEEEWLMNMHRMIDALADGKTTAQFLETL